MRPHCFFDAIGFSTNSATGGARPRAGRTRGSNSLRIVSSALFVSALALGPAVAHDHGSRLSGEIAFEVEDDWNYKADDRSNLNNNLYPTIEPSLTYRLSPRWSVFGHAVIETVGDAEKFENRMFEDIGLYMEDLYLEYAGDRFGAKAGKLNPGFGVAWDRAPGVYGTDIAEDYEISEQIGGVANWKVLSGTYGEHTVSGATFFADTTILSESALRGRGDNREEDGGLGNTESFKSFVAALDGEKIRGLGNFGYHLAFMRRAAGAGNASDEKSFAAAAFSSFDLGGGLSFEPLAELVRQIDQGGNAGVDRTYMTLSGQLLWNGWNLALSGTERYTDNPSAANNTDSHFQVSAGYAFDFGLTLDVGWKVSEDGGSETRTLGAIATYAIEF